MKNKLITLLLGVCSVLFVTGRTALCQVARQTAKLTLTAALQRAQAERTSSILVQPAPPSANLELPDVSQQSVLIAMGTLTKVISTNQLDSTTVQTTYSFKPALAIKGSLVPILNVTFPGGVLVLPNGSVVDVRTIESRRLRTGDMIVLCLVPSINGYKTVGGIEGIFSVNLQTLHVRSFTDFDNVQPHRMAGIDFGTVLQFGNRIKSAASTSSGAE